MRPPTPSALRLVVQFFDGKIPEKGDASTLASAILQSLECSLEDVAESPECARRLMREDFVAAIRDLRKAAESPWSN